MTIFIYFFQEIIAHALANDSRGNSMVRVRTDRDRVHVRSD